MGKLNLYGQGIRFWHGSYMGWMSVFHMGTSTWDEHGMPMWVEHEKSTCPTQEEDGYCVDIPIWALVLTWGNDVGWPMWSTYGLGKYLEHEVLLSMIFEVTQKLFIIVIVKFVPELKKQITCNEFTKVKNLQNVLQFTTKNKDSYAPSTSCSNLSWLKMSIQPMVCLWMGRLTITLTLNIAGPGNFTWPRSNSH